MLKHIIRRNIPLAAIVIYIILFAILNSIKPAFLYRHDGSIRDFGVGYKEKTFMPVWLISIILGILSYLFVMYYSHM